MHWLLGLAYVFAEGLYPCRTTSVLPDWAKFSCVGHSKRNKQESKLCGFWVSSLERNIVIIFYGLILIFSTSTLHWWRNIIYSLKEGDIKYIFQLLWKSGWEKEGIRMILLNWDLPLEIQPVKSKSQVASRPVQDLSCKWHEFAFTLFHSTSLHPFPISL